MVLWSYCTNTNAISEVNTNYTIFLSNNNSFLDPAGSSNNGLKNPQTEDKQWLYKSRLNPVVHGNVKTEQFHLVHRSQTCHAIQACKTNSNSKKKTKKKKKCIWASPGWLKVVLSNGCFVAHINLDSSNIQTDRQRDKQPSDIINMKKSHWISANFFKIWNNFAFQFHYLWIICINRNYFNHWHCLLPLKHRQNCLQSTECWPF